MSTPAPTTATGWCGLPDGLTLGRVHVDTPVVLAPMAGITNAAYRRLCREQGAGLYVCEMVTSRGLVERDPATLEMLRFDPLRGRQVGPALRHRPGLRRQGGRDPLRRARRTPRRPQLRVPGAQGDAQGRGRGAALEAGAAGRDPGGGGAATQPYGVPVTMKTRKGIDDDHLTYLDAGRIAQESGCAAIALHGRTVAQSYSGLADWDAVGELVAHVDIPVLGNGDIWEAEDALRMVRTTGAAGVVVGRGCLGRPWLFRDLAAAFAGRAGRDVADAGRGRDDDAPPRRAALGADGRDARVHGVPQAYSWYLKGFQAGGELRRYLALVDSLATLDGLLAGLDPDEPFPVSELGAPRGRQGQKPAARGAAGGGGSTSRGRGGAGFTGAEGGRGPRSGRPAS